MESDQFEEADGFWGKAKVMWDKIIAEPLSEWWNGPGKSKVVDTAGKIGMFLGEGITAAVLTIFGIETDLLGEGMNIGASFIDGFVQGFRGEEVASAIWEGMSNFFSSHPLASLILGGAGLSKLSGGLTPVLAPIVGAGKGIYKALKSDTAGKIGTSVIGSLIGTSAQTGGGRVVTGGLMKGASLSAGTASGLGMAATAGGIMAGATVISGATDLYKGYNADNEYDKKHSYIKGGVKLGGAGAGAAIGTAILPGVGTLIGAGIGGLAGWLSGGKLADSILGTKKNLDKYGTSSSEAARRLEELDEKQAALAESTLNRKFGDIALSADEVSKAVDGLFNPQQTARINSADTALNQLTSSFANLQEADMMLKKDLWMASVKDGAKLTSDEIANLKSSIKTYGETSKQYITDSQYAAHESTVALLGNSKAARDIINSTDKYYKDQQSKLSGYQSELSAALNKALSDGRIDINEEESLNTIRTKIAEITNEIANEEYLADMEVLKLNLEGDIDWKSFQSVMKEAYDGAKARLDALDKDYGYSASSITKGEGTKAEKETAIKILQWGDNGKGGVGNGTERGLYKEKVDIALEVENLGIDKIKDKFGQELGILGDDISEIMKNGPNKSMREALLALSNDGDTVAAISRMLKAMEPNTSELHRLEEAYREAGLVPPKAFREGLKQVDFLEAITNGTSAALEWLNDPDNRLTYKVGYETEEFDSSDVNVPDLVLNPSALVDPVYRFLNYDPSELIPPPTVLSPPTTVQPKYQYVQFNTGNLIPGITTLYPTINVNPQYNVLGKPPGFSYRGGIYGIPGFAEGGYVQGGSQLITVAEEGTPEAIIPLGKHRRKRAMELFSQVGGYLGAPGFASKGFAAGGIAGGTIQGSSGGSTEPVKVDVGGIAINIKAEDGQDLVDSIRGNENEIAEVIAGVLNRALKGKFANTPAKGEA